MPRYNVEAELPKKRIAANGYRLPDPIREGEIFTDIGKKQWRLGRSIGVGGFGEIYLASDDITKPVASDARYVIKVEPHANGPLFVEMNFYLRVAKLEMIDVWVARNELKALGMPYYVGAGSHVYKGERYRFLIIPRFGDDLQKLLIQHKKKFHIKTVLTLASYIIDTLEYIHGSGYIHADIKPGNLLVGTAAQAPVYLVDFGLACRYKYRNGQHKEADERKIHYGTIEYTSRDAHQGAISRRGDLEVLGYNLVHWLSGHLPWEDDVADPEIVAEKKRYSMENIHEFLKSCFAPEAPPETLEKYLLYVKRLGYSSQPNYKYCKKLFRMGIRNSGFVDDNKLTFTIHSKLNKSKKRKIDLEPENRGPNNAAKRLQLAMREQCNRKPCAPQNSNRMTRNAVSALSNEMSLQDFDWAMVLAGDPEQKFRKDKEKQTPKTDFEYSPRMVKDSSYYIPDEDSWDNPTPAMLQVLTRMKQRAKEAALANNSSNKRSKSESSRCSSPTECTNSNALTPAMEEVIRRRHSVNITRTTRSASRKGCKRNLNLSLTTVLISSETKTALTSQNKRSTRLSSLKG
ncbi:serine/threonine-protein kinase VRK1-like [Lycorma delicatula]|uniref:serine/threonine-protein kinase VRK1-like n=1 Tax=Lycorma delicatula TaxID=130591 RepID=UPI003F5175AC